MSGSNCCFLTCIQVSQEAFKVSWYSHLFKNVPQSIVIYTVKGFSIGNEAVVFFWNSLSFSMIQQMLAIWSLVPLPFLNPPWIRVNSRRWWRTGTPGVLWYMWLQNVGHDLATAQQQQGNARKEWFIWHCVKQHHYLKQSQKTLANWEKISVRYNCRYINNSRKFFNEG